jgi:hypothetical protein
VIPGAIPFENGLGNIDDPHPHRIVADSWFQVDAEFFGRANDRWRMWRQGQWW